MAKYVFMNVPAYGHVNPTLAVVKELVERGEDVVYYLTEEFRSAVEATGATFRPYESFMSKPPQGKVGAGMMGNQKRETLSQMLERVRAEQPDYIVYDAMYLWARVIAQVLGVPTILTCPMFVANEHFNPLKAHFNLLSGQVKVPSPVPPAALERIQAEISEVCTRYNVPPFDMSDFYTYTAPLNIVFIPRAFHPAGETFDERFVFVGPPLMVHNDVSQAQRSKLYISLGTVFSDRADFFNLCFEAFGKSSWQVVMAVGNRVDETALGPVPANFQVAPYVQQFEVFPHTSVFITHAGMSSVMESLYYGVPMVAIPQQNEQAITAQRVAELGLGVVLDKDNLTVEALQEAVVRVCSDPTFRARAQAMQQIVCEAGGAQSAADAMQDFARKRTLAVHF